MSERQVCPSPIPLKTSQDAVPRAPLFGTFFLWSAWEVMGHEEEDDRRSPSCSGGRFMIQALGQFKRMYFK